MSDDYLENLTTDVCNPIGYVAPVDFILHLASNTHPKQYAEDPIGTILTNIDGCNNLLRLAVEKKARFYLHRVLKYTVREPRNQWTNIIADI